MTVTQPEATRAAGVVLAYLREQAQTLRSLDPVVRRNEPDAVHRMRVATRRIRSTFRSFGQIIDRSATERLDGELKWLADLLGAVRDCEVLSARLLANLRRTPVEQVIGPVQARVRGHFASAEAAARAELLTAMDSRRYIALIDELDRLIASPPLKTHADEPAAEILPAAVRRAYRRARRRIRDARHAPPGPPREVALHQARKATKRARYAAEAVAPAVGKKAKRFAGQLKKVQSLLGDHQDAILTRQAARELGISAHLAGENAFTYGLVYEWQVHESELLQSRAPKVWKHAARVS
jgi:CHAD domain-containing protein